MTKETRHKTSLKGDLIPVAVLLKDDDGDNYVPLTKTEFLGSGGAGAATVAPARVIQMYPEDGQALTLGAAPTALTVPEGANRARIEVTSGSVRWAYGTPGPQTNLLEVGDWVMAEDAQLAALRLIQGELGGATAWVDYWRMG